MKEIAYTIGVIIGTFGGVHQFSNLGNLEATILSMWFLAGSFVVYGLYNLVMWGYEVAKVLLK